MTSFRNAKKQAKYAIKQQLQIGQARHTNRHDNKIHSLGTKRNFTQALILFTKWLQKNKRGDLKSATVKIAKDYLEERGQQVAQKTLDQDRQALQLYLTTKLPVIKSELTQALKTRAYSNDQVKKITEAQTKKYQLATHIALSAGLRAHELFTLCKINERSASSHRNWSKKRFLGREGQRYSVIGKGGLIREVLIPLSLAQQLETNRLEKTILITDRGIHYEQQYDLGGGKNWSNSFSAASNRCFGWSHGAHGLRHTYAQQRMSELQLLGLFYQTALSIVSQELGHFRPDITEVYLR